jgi:hypothetical protein
MNTGGRPQMEAKDVAASLALHEAVCAERWMSMRKAFESVEAKIDKFFWAMLACAFSAIAMLILQFFKMKGG